MDSMIRKALDAEISTSAKGFTATITAETLDRDGEVLIPQGMNSVEFEKNPTLFWNHDYSEPIGTTVELKRRERDILGVAETLIVTRGELGSSILTGDGQIDVAAVTPTPGMSRAIHPVSS